MSNLPALPPLPSSSSPRRLKACACGCAGVTASTFCPGHDSTLKAWVIRVERGIIAIGDIGHAGLEKAVREVLKARAAGKNPTFMRNVALPKVETKPETEAIENVG